MLTHQKFALDDKVIMELRRRIEALEESAGGGSDLANRVEALELALAQKADTSYVNTELGKKVNTTTFNTELGKKADTSYVNTELGKKADTTYVDTELAGKVDVGEVYLKPEVDGMVGDLETEVAKKADTSYVNTELGKKANASDLADLEARVAALEEANQ